jgi:hypothetical protein
MKLNEMENAETSGDKMQANIRRSGLPSPNAIRGGEQNRKRWDGK